MSKKATTSQGPAPADPQPDAGFRDSLLGVLDMPPEEKKDKPNLSDGDKPSEPGTPEEKSTPPAPEPEANADGEPSGDGDGGQSDSEANDKPSDAETIAELREMVKRQGEQIAKLSKPVEPEAATKPKAVEEYSTEDIQNAIAFWKNPDNEVANADVLIAKAQAELSRRAGKEGAETALQAERFKQGQIAWAQRARVDFPEAFDDKGQMKADSPLIKLAATAYEKMGLQAHVDGHYRALEWAEGVMSKEARKSKKDGNGNGDESPAKPAPPPIRGTSPAASRTAKPSAKDEQREKSDEALKRYDASQSTDDLAAALKPRITKT